MRLIAVIALSVATVLSAGAAAEQYDYPQTEADWTKEYSRLDWRDKPGEYKLSRSHATIRLKSGYALLLGPDAERLSYLNSGVEFPDTEAVIAYNTEGAGAAVYYEWREEGYVSDSDWTEADPDALLQTFREGAESGNRKRASNGISPMEVVGWLEQPRYDKKSGTVTYSIEVKDNEGVWVNAFALRLGRKGYARFTWVGGVSTFKNAGSRPALLNLALSTHSFDKGYRYSDFTAGDEVASYGIAGLLAAALGAKFGKGIFAGLFAVLLGSKKVVIPGIIAVAAGAFALFKRMFGAGEAGA